MDIDSLSPDALLARMRDTIPFLRDIPDDIYRELDPDEWLLPTGDIERARTELELGLKANVMTYKKDTFRKDLPAHGHLCMNLEGAALNPFQKEVLRFYEERFADRNVSFVAYAKPLRILQP